MSDRQDLTALIRRAGDGDPDAAEALFAETYADLRRLARVRLRAGGRNTVLDTGALVHESYLRFAAAGRLRIEDRTLRSVFSVVTPCQPGAALRNLLPIQLIRATSL